MKELPYHTDIASLEGVYKLGHLRFSNATKRHKKFNEILYNANVQIIEKTRFGQK